MKRADESPVPLIPTHTELADTDRVLRLSEDESARCRSCGYYSGGSAYVAGSPCPRCGAINGKPPSTPAPPRAPAPLAANGDLTDEELLAVGCPHCRRRATVPCPGGRWCAERKRVARAHRLVAATTGGLGPTQRSGTR